MGPAPRQLSGSVGLVVLTYLGFIPYHVSYFTCFLEGPCQDPLAKLEKTNTMASLDLLSSPCTPLKARALSFSQAGKPE